MKTLILSVLFSLTSHAAHRTLDRLQCQASNGVEIKYEGSSQTYMTSGFGMSRRFSRGIVTDWGPGLRLALSRYGQRNLYLYDLYLFDRPAFNRSEEVKGVLGSTIYFPISPAPLVVPPVPFPMGYVPIATVKCIITLQP